VNRRSLVLTELGLTPLWVRRRAAPVGEETGAVQGAVHQELAPLPAAQPLPADDGGAQIGAMNWQQLKAAVAGCASCVLHKQRQQAVFGVGDEQAEWLFVGEGPGAEEDARGEPFVGQAGKLLDNMLAAIGLKRGSNVYIANILKCRPPGNRNPEPHEALQCEPYLHRQIELIRPKLIIALGRVAAANLLASEASVAAMRGKIHRYRSIPLVVTYHPAYLLRNLPDKAKAWTDLCFAVRTMGVLRKATEAPMSRATSNE